LEHGKSSGYLNTISTGMADLMTAVLPPSMAGPEEPVKEQRLDSLAQKI
jgi:hypothetical protein